MTAMFMPMLIAAPIQVATPTEVMRLSIISGASMT